MVGEQELIDPLAPNLRGSPDAGARACSRLSGPAADDKGNSQRAAEFSPR